MIEDSEKTRMLEDEIHDMQSAMSVKALKDILSQIPKEGSLSVRLAYRGDWSEYYKRAAEEVVQDLNNARFLYGETDSIIEGLFPQQILGIYREYTEKIGGLGEQLRAIEEENQSFKKDAPEQIKTRDAATDEAHRTKRIELCSLSYQLTQLRDGEKLCIVRIDLTPQKVQILSENDPHWLNILKNTIRKYGIPHEPDES